MAMIVRISTSIMNFTSLSRKAIALYFRSERDNSFLQSRKEISITLIQSLIEALITLQPVELKFGSITTRAHYKTQRKMDISIFHLFTMQLYFANADITDRFPKSFPNHY